MSLQVEHNGRTWHVDYDGFLISTVGDATLYVSPGEDWYDYVRMKNGIQELTFDHIEVLEFYQDYYRNNGIAPHIRLVAMEVKKTQDSILKLFMPSKNPILTIVIMAGLPHPVSCN